MATLNTLLHSLVALGKHQTGNLTRLMSGQPVLQPGFLAQTVEEDDVALAESYLADFHRVDPSSWGDPESLAATIREYEAAFATIAEVPRATSFRSGREALSACLEVLDLPLDAEVILPGYTCVVVPNAIRFARLRPVFADIELQTYGLSIESLAERMSPRTGAIIVQHLYGLVCRDYEAILEFAAARGIPVIEDCAHALGARFQGRPVGTRGKLAFFSTEQSKILCTVNGGMATTSDPRLATELAAIQGRAAFPEDAWVERALKTLLLLYASYKDPRRWWLRNVADLRYGRDQIISTSKAEEVGKRPSDYGQRLPAPLAAIGTRQLAKLATFQARRQDAARRWDAWCADRGLVPPLVLDESDPAFLRYPVCVDPEQKADLTWAKRELGFTPGVWFSGTLHPVHRDLPDCPQAHTAVARCINLPTLL